MILFEIETDKVSFTKEDKVPLYLEQLSEEEIQEVIKSGIRTAEERFVNWFENNDKVHDRIVSNEIMDSIRYGFLYWCVMNHINIIKYEKFAEFAKKYNVQETITIVYDIECENFEQDLTLEQVRKNMVKLTKMKLLPLLLNLQQILQLNKIRDVFQSL